MTALDITERLAELKPCAHCEGEAELQSSKGPTGELYEWVQCVDCEAVSACVDTRSMQPEEMHPVDLWNTRADDTVIAELQAQVAAMREALAPFAAMARVMEMRASMTFGRHPKDSEIVCESSGEVGMGILTMGHFRDAAFLLPDAPGWGGQYRPIKARAALQPKDQSNG